nr:DUF6083 domain-containing protein [Micrococcus sp. ACRRV]
MLSDPADDAPATYLWSKPKRGRCRRCRLPIIWIYTEREAPWPFQPEEYESAGLPPKAQWRLPRRRKIIAIQRPAERLTDKVLIPHMYVCPFDEDSDSPALLRIQNELRASLEEGDAEERPS